MAFCHPFDDPAVVAGQGTLGLELVEDLDDLALRRRPARRRRAGERRRHRRQVAAAPRAGRRRAGRGVRALRRARPRRRARSLTLADGIAVKRPGVHHPAAGRAVGRRDRHRRRGRHRRRDGAADGPGQALRRGRRGGRRGRPAVGRRARRPTTGTTCVVLSGGNVDLGVVPGLIRRHETTAGRRLVDLRPRSTTAPAAWCGCSRAFAAAGANLSRSSTSARASTCSVRETGVHATFEVRGPEHAAPRGRRPPARPATATSSIESPRRLSTGVTARSTYWSVGCP